MVSCRGLISFDFVTQKKSLNEAAVFCHDANHEWVMKSMISQLERHRTNSAENQKPLNIDVFTVGESIKVGNGVMFDARGYLTAAATLGFVWLRSRT